MGTLGNSIRNFVRTLIATSNIRSSITLTPILRTIGDSGGYEAVTETIGTARTVYSVPSEYISERIELMKFGDLRTGETRLIIRDDESVDTNDKITFENADYNIRTINPIFFNEVVVCKELILSEKLG